MPTVTIEDDEIDSVREVAGESDFNYVSTLIDNLNDAQWDRALEFVNAWGEIDPGGLVGLSGGRDGLQLSDQLNLDDVRKRMRLLLGLPELRAADAGGFSHVVLTEARW